MAKVEKPISSLVSYEKDIGMKIINGLLFGALLGIASSFIHNAWPPLGLLIAIAGTFLGIRFIGQNFFDRTIKLFALVGWAFVVWRASTIGNGDELLITGGTTGTYFIVVGFLSALIAALLTP
jgi:hypothetical protein